MRTYFLLQTKTQQQLQRLSIDQVMGLMMALPPEEQDNWVGWHKDQNGWLPVKTMSDFAFIFKSVDLSHDDVAPPPYIPPPAIPNVTPKQITLSEPSAPILPTAESTVPNVDSTASPVIQFEEFNENDSSSLNSKEASSDELCLAENAEDSENDSDSESNESEEEETDQNEATEENDESGDLQLDINNIQPISLAPLSPTSSDKVSSEIVPTAPPVISQEVQPSPEPALLQKEVPMISEFKPTLDNPIVEIQVATVPTQVPSIPLAAPVTSMTVETPNFQREAPMAPLATPIIPVDVPAMAQTGNETPLALNAQVAPPQNSSSTDEMRRKHPRFEAKLRVVITNKKNTFLTFTKDVSLGGMQLLNDIPEYIFEGESEVFISGPNNRDSIRFKCKAIGDAQHKRRLEFDTTDKMLSDKLNNWIHNSIAPKSKIA